MKTHKGNGNKNRIGGWSRNGVIAHVGLSKLFLCLALSKQIHQHNSTFHFVHSTILFEDTFCLWHVCVFLYLFLCVVCLCFVPLSHSLQSQMRHRHNITPYTIETTQKSLEIDGKYDVTLRREASC